MRFGLTLVCLIVAAGCGRQTQSTGGVTSPVKGMSQGSMAKNQSLSQREMNQIVNDALSQGTDYAKSKIEGFETLRIQTATRFTDQGVVPGKPLAEGEKLVWNKDYEIRLETQGGSFGILQMRFVPEILSSMEDPAASLTQQIKAGIDEKASMPTPNPPSVIKNAGSSAAKSSGGGETGGGVTPKAPSTIKVTEPRS